MTIIVAVRKENSLAIAADSQANQGQLIDPGEMRRDSSKIQEIAGAYIGLVGSPAHDLVLRSLAASKPKLFNFDSADAIFETFRKIHPLLREEYYLVTTEGKDEEQEYESNHLTGLVMSRGGIFSFFSFREVSEHSFFWAAGSGMEYALGSLEATYKSRRSPKSLAETAVAAACKFDSGCGLPLNSYELEL
jgi:ATP-dependent protease HslVU (ClpYQ) peptidase subunit